MKFSGVAIQMKPLQQYFHMVLFVLYVVLTFEPLSEIQWCCHSNESSLAEPFHSSIHFGVFYHKNWRFLASGI